MRDDFSVQVKEMLAKRVGYHCSNPDCQRLTIGPQVSPEKAVNIGVAAHITAAASGGPRYDASLSQETRSSFSNGIWLCQNCAKLVDSDVLRYPVSILQKWKALTEAQTLLKLENYEVYRKRTSLHELEMGLAKAPKNIFEYLTPGISLERMREFIGVPHRVVEGHFTYTFKDALVQINSLNGLSINVIAVGLKVLDDETCFPIYPSDFVLGQTVLSDVLTQETHLKKRNTLKSEELIVEAFYGLPAFNRYFTYGALWAPFIYQSDFIWDYKSDVLVTDPKDILINWASVSNSLEEVMFDFWAFY